MPYYGSKSVIVRPSLNAIHRQNISTRLLHVQSDGYKHTDTRIP